MAPLVEDLIKLLDSTSNSLRRGRYPDRAEARKVAGLLRAVRRQPRRLTAASGLCLGRSPQGWGARRESGSVRPGEQGLGRGVALVAEVAGEVVDVELDVLRACTSRDISVACSAT